MLARACAGAHHYRFARDFDADRRVALFDFFRTRAVADFRAREPDLDADLGADLEANLVTRFVAFFAAGRPRAARIPGLVPRSIAHFAAASRATGTRNGEQLT